MAICSIAFRIKRIRARIKHPSCLFTEDTAFSFLSSTIIQAQLKRGQQFGNPDKKEGLQYKVLGSLYGQLTDKLDNLLWRLGVPTPPGASKIQTVRRIVEFLETEEEKQEDDGYQVYESTSQNC